MSAAIAIFVKTPGLSPLKTRLAVDIGEDKAHEFYHLSVQAVEETAGQVDAAAHWAVAEEEGLDDPLWAGLERLHSGDGDLGARQHHVYETLRREYKNVILIGADAPQLSSEILEQAIAALDKYDFVIGPAHDGGYYLFGGCVAVEKNIWTQVPWSAENTRIVFESLLPSKVFRLPSLTDVDVQKDIQAVIDEMPDSPSEEQQKLIGWLNR